tara:strand:+ start:1152 stop:1604 length:453 start_codon:yes stop_codon:yes gene_type:complete
MNKDVQIVWEKWYCPFGQDDPEAESLLDSAALNELLEEIDEENSEEAETLLPPIDLDQKLSKQFGGQKFMITPMGVMPITDNTISTKIFNFWTGHTNFNISTSVADTIQRCDGVESLDVFTRYRFRISIGKVFKESDVMHTINQKVYESL